MNSIRQIIEFLINSLGNPWIIFGFSAQTVFFARVVVQYLASEKSKKIIVPTTYWHLGIVGSIMIFIYAVHRMDIVFITSAFLNFLICTRSLIIHKKHESRKLAVTTVSLK